jgi:hypothetical protein
MHDREENSQAGLSYAPPYDKSQEFDPDKAEVITTPETVKPEDFEYFRERMEKQGSLLRVLVVTVLIIAVGTNMLLTLRSQRMVVQNINQARADQVDLDERLVGELEALNQRVRSLEATIAAMPGPPPVEPAATE